MLGFTTAIDQSESTTGTVTRYHISLPINTYPCTATRFLSCIFYFIIFLGIPHGIPFSNLHILFNNCFHWLIELLQQ